MDKKKSILNISVSVFMRLLTMVVAVIATRCLIQTYGNEVNGLNALYVSILGVLAVAELGVGSAITFCMYRPIVQGDCDTVSGLYHMFRRWYLVIGVVILVCGLGLVPFLHLFARDYACLDVNLYSSFVLMLLSVVLTYLFGAKSALINAHKNNYITTAISSGGLLLQYGLQIIVLSAGGSFAAYLICRSVSVLIQWVVTEGIANRRYGHIISNRVAIASEVRREVTGKIRAMFMHKIGNLLVNTVDSIVISGFIGVAVLGIYSNYITIQSAVDNTIRLLFSSLVSVVGHMFVEQNSHVSKKYCDGFHLINFLVGVLFYLGYYAVIDDLIAILFGDHLVAEGALSMVIAVNGFIQFMRCNTLTFRDATGTFYHDRWKPLLEGMTNLVLSILLVKQIGVTGVILATILTNIVVCHIVEPYVLYKHAFRISSKVFFMRNYAMIGLFVVALLEFDFVKQSLDGHWASLLVNGSISVMISAVAGMIAVMLDRDGRAGLKILLRKE